MRNSIEFEGTITRDPDSGYGKGSGVPFWRANIANNGTRYDSQTKAQALTTTFGQAVAFGYKAEELMQEALERGDQLLIRGQLGNNTYEDGDGKKVTKTQIEVIAYDIIRKKNSTPPQRQPQAQQNPDWGTPPPAAQDDPWATPANRFQ